MSDGYVSRPSLIALIAFVALTAFPAMSVGQTNESQSLSTRDVLTMAVEHNPSLRSAVIELERAELAFRRELYTFVPTWSVDASAQIGRRPNLSTMDIVTVESQAYEISTGLSHTFPAGTTVSGTIGVDNTLQDSPFFGDLGSTWGADIQLQVVQPWLRGFGHDTGLAARRSARAESDAAVAQRNDEASRLARDVLTAYWQVWSAQRNVTIQQEALEVADRALEDAESRLEAGAIAEADLVPLKTEAARIRETLASSRSTLVSRRIELARLLGMERQPNTLRASGTPPEPSTPPAADEAVEQARQRSYTLMQQRRQIDVAQAQAAIAQDQRLPRLDTTATLNASGLGRDLPPALDSLTGLDGIVGTFSVNLQLPVVNKSLNAQARRAQLAVDRAEAQFEATEDQVVASVQDQVDSLRTAQTRLKLARETARLAGENVDYQRARFDNGAATALDVAEALQDQREAQLQVAQLRAETATRRLALQDLTGTLLGRLTLEEVPSE
jgi:outer membrane protein TolC